MPLTLGTRLGPYEVVAPLGSGGMGEVYRARDTRLGREVAVKVLPEHLWSSSEVRLRFEREAKAVSALNHPNICVLHDIGREGRIDYLVMELVEGETLESRLQRGPLPLADTLKIGAEIAQALGRAHRAGVVHRDLKPGNIMLTPHGAKLMDFGLARATGGREGGASGEARFGETASPTAAAPLTSEGMLVGTFLYMAPEQLEAKEADVRTDLWALGCVLYEMATGQRAFSGDSQASLIAAIMDREPRAMSELQPITPPALERVVRRCLQKAPDARMQDASDVAFVLQLIAEGGVPEAVAGAAGPQARRGPGPAAFGAIAIAALILIAIAFFAGRMFARPESGSLRVIPLSHGSRDGDPAVSPNGQLVAFSAIRPGGPGIWIMDVATRSETRLTNGVDTTPRFSPDGSMIYFSRQAGDTPSIWRVPAIGGPARTVVDFGVDLDCSPDGTRLAFMRFESDSAGPVVRLMTARTDGSDVRRVYEGRSIFLGTPRWSADGHRIALIRTANQNVPNAVVLVDVAAGRARSYPSPHLASLSAACWDGTGRGLLLAEGETLVASQLGGQGQLLRFDTGSGRYRPLAWLPSMPIVLDMLPDGRLVMSTSVYRQSLREMPIEARSLAEGRWLTQGSASDRQPTYTPDGQWVIFSSNRGGTLDLWEVSTQGGELRRITDDPANDWDPFVTRDGSRIYWSSDRSGAFEIWSARSDGSAPLQVSHDSLDAENPFVLPDGSWVYYSSANPAKAGLWRVTPQGEHAGRVLAHLTLIPDLSPDSRYVSVAINEGIAKLSVFDLEHQRLLPYSVTLRQGPTGSLTSGRSRWTPDGKFILYLSLDASSRALLLRRPLEDWITGGTHVDTLYSAFDDIIESFGVAPDGRTMTASVLQYLSGLSVAGGIKGVAPRRETTAEARATR